MTTFEFFKTGTVYKTLRSSLYCLGEGTVSVDKDVLITTIEIITINEGHLKLFAKFLHGNKIIWNKYSENYPIGDILERVA